MNLLLKFTSASKRGEISNRLLNKDFVLLSHPNAFTIFYQRPRLAANIHEEPAESLTTPPPTSQTALPRAQSSSKSLFQTFMHVPVPYTCLVTWHLPMPPAENSKRRLRNPDKRFSNPDPRHHCPRESSSQTAPKKILKLGLSKVDYAVIKFHYCERCNNFHLARPNRYT